jgi:hypothetical protein
LQAQRHCPELDRSEWLLPEASVFESLAEKIGEEGFVSCPFALIDEDAVEAVELWGWAEKGILPRAGGLEDQRELDLQLIMAVERGVQRIRED